jgi:hypothetical protein
MNTFLWIVAGQLALVFLAVGTMKVLWPRETLVEHGMGWAADFSPGTIVVIGVLELLAALGLIVPAVLGIMPALVPLAALGLVVLMAGAAITHARRDEHRLIALNVVLAALAAAVVWGWSGPHSPGA